MARAGPSAREPVDRGAAGKRKPEQSSGLVEGLAGGVVARPRDDAHSRRALHVDELRMSAGDEQRDEGVRRLDVAFEETPRRYGRAGD